MKHPLRMLQMEPVFRPCRPVQHSLKVSQDPFLFHLQISLDLGVSISPNQSNLSYETHTRETDQIQHHQSESGGIGGSANLATPPSNTTGISHARIYESGEGFAVRTAPLNASSDMYYSAPRKTVMGP